MFFFQAAVVSVILYGCTTETLGKARLELHKKATIYIEQILKALGKSSKLDEEAIWVTAGETRTNS